MTERQAFQTFRAEILRCGADDARREVFDARELRHLRDGRADGRGLNHVEEGAFDFEAFASIVTDIDARKRAEAELEDGSVVEVPGNEEIEYDGEVHSAANLYDALKEGYYGKF